MQPQGVGASAVNDFVWADDVAARLGHPLAVGGMQDALRAQARERLVEVQQPRIVQRLGPEAGVQQVADGLLRAAHVEVHWQPGPYRFGVEWPLGITRVGEAQEVPRRAGGAAHGVGLATRRPSTARTRGLDELGHVRQRRLAVAVGAVVLDGRQAHGQLIARDRDHPALVAVDNGDGRAPVPLARDQPVVQVRQPVQLQRLDVVGPVHAAQTVTQPISVGGDAKEPLGANLFLHHRPAAPAHAALDLLVCQHGLAAGTPVDGRVGAVGQPTLVQGQENPLGPAIIIGVAGPDFALPVVGAAQACHLAAVIGRIAGDGVGRVDALIDGLVLGGQAKSVPAHRVQHGVALAALDAGQYIGRDVVAGVADAQPCAGGVGEEVQAVKPGWGGRRGWVGAG